MPVAFPHKDADTGALVDVDYYTTAEVSGMLHVSRDAVRHACRDGRWPHLRVNRLYFLNANDVDAVVELMRVDPDMPPQWTPRTLGVAIDPDELEGVQ